MFLTLPREIFLFFSGMIYLEKGNEAEHDCASRHWVVQLRETWILISFRSAPSFLFSECVSDHF